MIKIEKPYSAVCPHICTIFVPVIQEDFQVYCKAVYCFCSVPMKYFISFCHSFCARWTNDKACLLEDVDWDDYFSLSNMCLSHLVDDHQADESFRRHWVSYESIYLCFVCTQSSVQKITACKDRDGLVVQTRRIRWGCIWTQRTSDGSGGWRPAGWVAFGFSSSVFNMLARSQTFLCYS